MHDDPKRLGALDGVLMVGAAISTAVTIMFPLFVVPSFVTMFRDFGGAIPTLTRIAISGAFSLSAVALVALASLAGFALTLTGHRGPGRTSLIAAFGIAMLFCAFMVVALYLPIFQLAGAVQP